MSQTLKKIIEAPGILLGTTSTGRDWCTKALHPSDPVTEIRGIPDHSAIPTVCMNYQSTFSLRTTSETTWSFDASLLPNPLYFAYWQGTDVYVVCPESEQTHVGAFWNAQLTTGTGMPTHTALFDAWVGIAQRWRLAYYGCTIYQDGPDLANQGTLVVSQAPLTPTIYSAGGSSAIGPVMAGMKLAYFDQTAQGPSFQRSQAMPNAMMGRSKEGAYVPLKLTDTCQDWLSVGDSYGIIPAPTGVTEKSVTFRTLGDSAMPMYPFENVMASHEKETAPGVAGQAVPCLMSSNVAHVCARNLSPQTSFTFYFRVGIEMQLASSSSLTPQLKLSPPFDRQALDAYFVLAREMKDAYPADYNDLGKMWSVISKAVRKTAPVLRNIAPLAPYVGAAEAAVKLGDSVRKKRRGKKKAGAR